MSGVSGVSGASGMGYCMVVDDYCIVVDQSFAIANEALSGHLGFLWVRVQVYCTLLYAAVYYHMQLSPQPPVMAELANLVEVGIAW